MTFGWALHLFRVNKYVFLVIQRNDMQNVTVVAKEVLVCITLNKNVTRSSHWRIFCNTPSDGKEILLQKQEMPSENISRKAMERSKFIIPREKWTRSLIEKNM